MRSCAAQAGKRAGGVRRIVRAVLAASLLPFLLCGVVRAEPVNGEATVTTTGGYVRILVKLEDEVPARVTQSGSVLIVAFEKPVSVPVDKLGGLVPSYISAARQDPDGMSIRIALAQKVTVHSIPAAERLYIDLLPVGWVGLPPGLPQSVIDELAQRARDAEKKLRSESVQEPVPLIRVKVGVQPTFVRYIFDLPKSVTARSEKSPGKMTLAFNRTVKFDLADAQATLPANVVSIDSGSGGTGGASSVTFRFRGKPLVRSFREDGTVMVDVETAGLPRPAAKLKGGAQAKAGDLVVAPPLTVPAAADQAKQPQDKQDDKHSAAGAGGQKAADQPEPPAQSSPPSAPALSISAPAVRVPGEEAMAAAEPVMPEPETPRANAEAPVKPSASQITKAEPLPSTHPQPLIAANPSPPPLPTVPAATSPSQPTAMPDTAPAFVHAEPKSGPASPEKSDDASPAPAAANGEVKIIARADGSGERLDFPFGVKTPAAAFRRGQSVWLVFDTDASLSAARLASEPGIRHVSISRTDDGATVVRIEFANVKLLSFFSDGPGWTLVSGDTAVQATKPIAIARSIVGKGRSSITIPFNGPQKLHRIKDPSVGETLLVVTALAPSRGFLKSQDFVELRALASIHGVAIQPLADDVSAELSADKIVVTRPGGLSLSSASLVNRDNTKSDPGAQVVFDNQTWGFDRHANFRERQTELMNRAADAPEQKRLAARLDLARFYLARNLVEEAKGVLDVATADESDGDGPTGSILKSVSDVLLGRPQDALKALAVPHIGTSGEAPIWRAMAHATEGDCIAARDEFKPVEVSIGALPIELQRRVKIEELKCAIAVKDFGGASAMVDDFETLGAPPEIAPTLEVLTGQLQEGLGRTAQALASYRLAAASHDRREAMQAKLRELVLSAKLGDVKRADMISRLEELTTEWRGDATEAEALKLLAHYYTLDNRYRDAFHVMRTAMLAHPNSDMTRQIQDEAAATFDKLFLGGGDASMPPIQALGLFYDYRELTPIGRRGDEMIRHLADRLVSVDLLDQASELLQHQVDYRLQGAARAQVAAKLAMIYLMNRKPDLALSALQRTRVSDLAGDLRDQRLLLEARAMSEIGRHDLALEVVDSMKGPQALHLRADILWAAKRWREAAEAIERLEGDRWEIAGALSNAERVNVLRMAIGYALADEPLSLTRLRDRYGPKMAESPDRHAFEVVTAPIGSTSSEFRSVAAAVSGVQTLDAFLADMRKRYPDRPLDDGQPQASAPQTKPASSEQVAKGDGKPPAPVAPVKSDGNAKAADKSPTGSIARRPRRQLP